MVASPAVAAGREPSRLRGCDVISLRRMSLGAGYRYLMESIAAGDGVRRQSMSLTDYYAESGTPPGVFLGAGRSGFPLDRDPNTHRYRYVHATVHGVGRDAQKAAARLVSEATQGGSL